MSERPTPETDAFSVKFKSVCGSKAWVPTDICRRFERERDEARELCRELNDLVAYGLGQSGEEWSLEAMRQAADAIQKAKSLEEQND
jgi:hypothetical protein